MSTTDDDLADKDRPVLSGDIDQRAVNSLSNYILGFLAANPKWVQVGIWTTVLGSTTIGIGLWLGGYMEVQDVGYLATFYLNLVGAATIILPLPGVLAACVAAEPALGLHPILIALSGAAGASLGETTAYLAGFSGHNAAAKLKWYPRIHDLMEKNGGATLFVISAVPTPIFDLAGIAAGALEYPYRKFLIYVFIGKFIRLTIMAYACRSGIEWLRNIYEFNLPIG